MTLKDKKVLDEGKPGSCPLGHTWQDESTIKGSCIQKGFIVYICAVCGRREGYKKSKD